MRNSQWRTAHGLWNAYWSDHDQYASLRSEGLCVWLFSILAMRKPNLTEQVVENLFLWNRKTIILFLYRNKGPGKPPEIIISYSNTKPCSSRLEGRRTSGESSKDEAVLACLGSKVIIYTKKLYSYKKVFLKTPNPVQTCSFIDNLWSKWTISSKGLDWTRSTPF